MTLPEYLSQTTSFLLEHGLPEEPEAAVILGSGLGGFAETISHSTRISYGDIPHFPATSIDGHSGELIFGEISGKQVMAFSGRFHHYEGHGFEMTALPVYMAKAAGSKKLIISNAAGGINTRFSVGDLMVIDSVMRLNHSSSPFHSKPFRYNMEAYARIAGELAAGIGLKTQFGSYMFAKGPNYETKAEVRAFRIMGADAVGMSTVPELIEASRLNMKTVAISLITNMAAGIVRGKLDHSEVKKAADSRKEDFARLVTHLIEHL